MEPGSESVSVSEPLDDRGVAVYYVLTIPNGTLIDV